MSLLTSKFFVLFISSWLSYGAFAIPAYIFKLYQVIPFLGFLGYATMIGLLLAALNEATKRNHYVLVSVSLIIFGVIASFDIISSKEELSYIWENWLNQEISTEKVDGFVQSILMLLNILTGSLASSSLFFSLNKDNFID